MTLQNLEPHTVWFACVDELTGAELGKLAHFADDECDRVTLVESRTTRIAGPIVSIVAPRTVCVRLTAMAVEIVKNRADLRTYEHRSLSLATVDKVLRQLKGLERGADEAEVLCTALVMIGATHAAAAALEALPKDEFPL